MPPPPFQCEAIPSSCHCPPCAMLKGIRCRPVGTGHWLLRTARRPSPSHPIPYPIHDPSVLPPLPPSCPPTNPRPLLASICLSVWPWPSTSISDCRDGKHTVYPRPSLPSLLRLIYTVCVLLTYLDRGLQDRSPQWTPSTTWYYTVINTPSHQIYHVPPFCTCYSTWYSTSWDPPPSRGLPSHPESQRQDPPPGVPTSGIPASSHPRRTSSQRRVRLCPRTPR